MLNLRLKQLLLLIGDIILLYGALFLTLAIRYGVWPDLTVWQRHSQIFIYIFLLWLAIFYIAGVYDLTRHFDSRFVKKTIQASVLAAIIAVFFFYLAQQSAITPKTNLALFTLIFTILFLAWRSGVNYLLKNRLPKTRLGIVGFNPRVVELTAILANQPQLGYAIKFTIKDQGDIQQLPQLIKQHRISLLVLAQDLEQSTEFKTILFNCLNDHLTYIALPHFYETITRRVPLEIISQGWFLENLNFADKYWFEKTKRLFDFVGALILGIISLILWPLIIAAIKLSGAGPIFFVQERVGQDNRIFKMIKFRSMRLHVDQLQAASDNDNRVTKVGGFLRQTRLDEIPQLINILKGEMSFIGPRPERPELADQLASQLPFYHLRHLIKPGATGWDQICGEYHSPSPEDTFKKLQYDFYYLKNRSLYLDTTIILKTIATIISKKGL